MRLIFLITHLRPWGTERIAVMMANHYANKGVDTTLLSVGRPGGAFRFDISSEVKMDCLNIPLESGWNLIRKIESVYAIRRYLQKKLDVVGAMNTPGNHSIGNETTILLGIGNFPIILSALVPKGERLRTIGCLHTTYMSIRHIWRFFRLLFYRKLDILVSLTQRDALQLRHHNPNVLVIPNPVPFYPEHSANLESKLILAVGRIDYLKGYDLMVEVFARFCRKNSDWKLKIVGEGPLQSGIEKLIRDKGLSDRMSITQATRHIEEEYMAASILLMTSRTESWGLVLTEAQACGLPIVAFDCETGPAEIVNHGTDGYLVKPWDIEEMSEHLLELAENRDKQKSFGACGRENVKRFLPDKIFKEWDELFDSL